MKPLRIAVAKGRLEEKTLELLAAMGMDCSLAKDKGRKLILPLGEGRLELVLAKAPDIITYVEYGVCEMGIVGKDTIMEMAQSLYEVMDLGFGVCRMALAAAVGRNFYQGFGAKTVATKYPHIARTYFESKAMDVNIVKIEGSVELAPLLGLADGIVDIVETGGTLRANGLEEKETVAQLSARLVVNVAGMKLRRGEIEAFLSRLRQALAKGETAVGAGEG
ncbi:MAG: ATP phosphoribosyltransferase [Peptococcaceae bacterium]|jgi:ATP phosphoribosyltransferase|nr:ATP phosphoribosyltransferase [Peptococcaceae bacterium]